MMKSTHYNQRGFTLVETLIAIFILALTVGALLTLASSGFFTIRYAKNDIVANNLLQESLEFVRNTRDTVAQQGTTWNAWINPLSTACSTASVGCIVNPYTTNPATAITQCTSDPCSYMSYFPDVGFYGYPGSNIFGGSNSQETSFIRTVTFEKISSGVPDPQLIVTAKIEWMNGLNKKEITQSIILSKWNSL